jgi:transcription termination factor Rho
MTQIDDTLVAEHVDSTSTTVTDRTGRPERPVTGTGKTGGLTAKTLSELQGVASSLGISGTARLRKGQLIEAIRAAQSGAAGSAEGTSNGSSGPSGSVASVATEAVSAERPEPRTEISAASAAVEPGADVAASQPRESREGRYEERPPRERNRNRNGNDQGERNQNNQGNQNGPHRDRQQGNQNGQNRDRQQNNQNNQNNQNRDQAGPAGAPREEWDEEGGGRNRRGRYRERRNRQGAGRPDGEPILRDDDVLVDIGGVVHMLDNYGFVRTSGYLAGPNDVYVSMAQVKRYGLRAGDVVRGAVRAQQEGEAKQKYNPLVRLDTINGMTSEEAKKRPEFAKLTPLYPNERLRLETEPHVLTTRIIDLVAPIGKGQRGLIVSPPKAGKTMVLQAIANAITTNNPEVHLMVVLVDERPEEVTDMQRSVKGEVIASTFDRHPIDHTTIAELSIERAKRLVEMGHDVVVLLDSLTRLGRAYNLAAPASGRILTGGVDSAALYPPKRSWGRPATSSTGAR